MTSSVSEVEHEEPGGESLSPPATAKIPGLAACGWMCFHGFNTYWMIKIAPSCTVYSVENTASHQKRWCGSVYHADSFARRRLTEHQKSQCHSGAALWFSRHCIQEHWNCRSVNSGRQLLVDINENFISLILMKHPVRILSWEKPCRLTQEREFKQRSHLKMLESAEERKQRRHSAYHISHTHY